MSDCFFCQILQGTNTVDVLYENNDVLVMLDDDWAVKGHTLVVWKRHMFNISDLSEEEFVRFSKVLQKVEKVLLELLKVDKSIILKSGGIMSHLHFHIYPVARSITWTEVKKMFDKDMYYSGTQQEKEQFTRELERGLM